MSVGLSSARAPLCPAAQAAQCQQAAPFPASRQSRAAVVASRGRVAGRAGLPPRPRPATAPASRLPPHPAAAAPTPPQREAQQRQRRGSARGAQGAASAAGAAPAQHGAQQQQRGGSAQDAQAAARPGDEYFAADARPIILFDGVCNLCNGGVNWMLSWDEQGEYRFAALQSEAGRALLRRSGRAPDDISSIVLVERAASFVKAAAVLRIAQRLRAPLPLVAAALDVFPRPFKDAVYDQVADNRYLLFGRTPACRLSDDRFADRFVA